LLKKKAGDHVNKGEPIAEFYTDKSDILTSAEVRITNAFLIQESKPTTSPLVISIVDKNGVVPFRY
jgi:pyrimidine-nucleoside phosphorylase